MKKRRKNRLTKKQWLRRRRLRFIGLFGSLVIIAITFIGFIPTSFVYLRNLFGMNNIERVDTVGLINIDEMFLTPNEYSRPGNNLSKVKGVVVHYTANPGTDALANRNYFESLRTKMTTYSSSHFIIGLEGNIIQCIPLNEIAYASNNRNFDTISIEVCHPDKTGKFTKKSYESLVTLVSWLSDTYGLKPKDIIRHYDVTGKLCPLYYVEHEDKWIGFKEDVFNKNNKEK